jgi:hypothetical protein
LFYFIYLQSIFVIKTKPRMWTQTDYSSSSDALSVSLGTLAGAPAGAAGAVGGAAGAPAYRFGFRREWRPESAIRLLRRVVLSLRSDEAADADGEAAAPNGTEAKFRFGSALTSKPDIRNLAEVAGFTVANGFDADADAADADADAAAADPEEDANPEDEAAAADAEAEAAGSTAAVLLFPNCLICDALSKYNPAHSFADK